MGFHWSEEAVADFRAYWKAGLSCQAIAERLTESAPEGQFVTRSAVSGKRRRLNLPGRDSATCNDPKPRRTARTKPKLPPAVETSHAVSVMDAQPHHCRYPLGNPKSADFRFCGHPVMPGSSYCEHHHAVVWRAPDDKPKEKPALSSARLEGQW